MAIEREDMENTAEKMRLVGWSQPIMDLFC